MHDVDDLLMGVSAVRWSRMRHAYGPATEVPALLRGLADADPAVRETALDAFHGAVHHQGDVYACTLAALPFLIRIATDTGRPGRAAVVTLIGSIGGITWDDPPSGPRYRQARREVGGAVPAWHDLLDDPDPEVRAATVPVLAFFSDTAAALRDRFATDTDPRARAALIDAVTDLARRGVEVEATAAWLAGILANHTDEPLRLAALTGLATLAGRPGVPTVDVHTALALLATVYERGTPVTEKAGYATDTLIGAVRQCREATDEDRTAPEADDLVRAINHGLGDRVADRVTLLTTLLRSENWECRLDALYPAGHLMHGWRHDYTELVRLIGDQLADPRHVLVDRAVYRLHALGRLAAPAADALVAALEGAQRVSPPGERRSQALAWVVEWRDAPGIGNALDALATIGDERALPMLEWTLELDRIPRYAAGHVRKFGPRAAGLVPLLRRLLAAETAAPSTDDPYRRDDLVHTLGAIGPAAADAVPDLLAVGPGRSVVRALNSIGTPDALPLFRECAAGAEAGLAMLAAGAAFGLDGDADAALAVYDRFIDGDRYDVIAAVDGIGGLGPLGASRAGPVRRVLRRRDEHGWLPIAAARALWRTTGDPAGAPLLEKIWDERPMTRREIAALWAEMGDAAAGARPRLEAELVRVRRHNAQKYGGSSDEVDVDEELLAICRRAVKAG